VRLVIALLLLLKILEKAAVVHHMFLQSQDRLDLVEAAVEVLVLVDLDRELVVMVDQALL
jgi:hypothetical protein|tara:strand:+ start:344 stop:523 length:180 start_codon:yes stop_codon:yes gene_type:complete